jgi:integrase
MQLGEHNPWPDDALEKALEIAEPMTRLALVLHLYTGQRIGDVCMMHRGSIKDGTIEVVQEKTGKTVWVPIHTKLRVELVKDQTPHLKWLLYNDEGARMRPRTLQHRLANLRVSYKAKYDEDLPWVWHGLRKNAVNALLEAGCTPSQVAAITGQTLKMIEHYSKGVNTRKLAIEAVKKWEQA